MSDSTSNSGDSRRIHIQAFPESLEEEARELYELACCGAQEFFSNSGDPARDLEDPKSRKVFYSLAHRGFQAAQHLIYRRMTGQSTLPKAEETLLRKTMDCIAWQMLGDQLYIGRRLYQGGNQPSPKHANLQSALSVADQLHSDDPCQFGLLSDLTTFVQVGDILTYKAGQGLRIYEVKEGKINEIIFEIIKSIGESRHLEAVNLFRKIEGDKSFRQLKRVVRQNMRMQYVADTLNKGSGVDPDTGYEITIPSTPLILESWDDELSSLLERAKERGWAIAHLDKCLYVGVYRGKMRLAAKEIFGRWFKEFSGNPKYPMTNLVNCMGSPLAKPIYMRGISDENKFDILFGRAVVYLGLDIDGFMNLCASKGLAVRWSSRKKAARFQQTPTSFRPWIFNNKAIIFGEREESGAMSDGIILRILFHGTRPVSAVELLSALSQRCK